MATPVSLKIIEDRRGDIDSIRNLIRFSIVNKPDVIAFEMLPIGAFDEHNAMDVCQFYGPQYLRAAKNLSKDGFEVCGVEQRHHMPFMCSIGGIWRNSVLRYNLSGIMEQEWLDSLGIYGGKKVVLFCGTRHANILRTLLKL